MQRFQHGIGQDRSGIAAARRAQARGAIPEGTLCMVTRSSAQSPRRSAGTLNHQGQSQCRMSCLRRRRFSASNTARVASNERKNGRSRHSRAASGPAFAKTAPNRSCHLETMFVRNHTDLRPAPLLRKSLAPAHAAASVRFMAAAVSLISPRSCFMLSGVISFTVPARLMAATGRAPSPKTGTPMQRRPSSSSSSSSA